MRGPASNGYRFATGHGHYGSQRATRFRKESNMPTSTSLGLVSPGLPYVMPNPRRARRHNPIANKVVANHVVRMGRPNMVRPTLSPELRLRALYNV